MTEIASVGASSASAKSTSSSSSSSQSTASTVPVLITGAGPTGLFEAYLLTKMGIQVRIIDREMALSPLSKAIIIQPRSMEVFQMSGLIDPLLAKGLPMTNFQFFIGTKRVAAMPVFGARTSSHYESSLILEQSKVCEILIEEMDMMGVQVDRGWELLDTKVVEESGHTFVETIIRRVFPGESTTPDDRKVLGEVDFSDEPVEKAYETQVVRSEYLVAADGARSTVRHKLNIGFPGRTRSHKTIMWDGTYECDLDLAGITFVHGVNNRTLSSFPLTNGTRRLMADAGDIEPGEDISKTLQELTPEKFEKLANDCIAPSRLKIKETNWLTIFKTNERRAERYIHRNRIFLAGDSVHVQSPAGGQGMNVGWHDAHNLAWKLAFVMNKIAPEALLETYQEREAMADKAIALATKLIDLERGTGVFTMIMMRIIYALAPYMFALMEALGFEEETHMVSYLHFTLI
ncbi:hypothetical protein BGZ98_004866 [Dissophora globulifera]|nr:hypothetical protein BGZ98_004866 [Dissophora globulifera]